ncbi:MAG: translation initiation factor IF-2 [Spirochaetes bacterium]|nr:translation initiation factor IF-2 [Spirochaetota bacterium]MBN2772362.1 translation initiation factor IF-2 [Spirochaetota bacterium]
MKAEEIAKKNLVKTEDVFSICKDLGIECKDAESSLSDSDTFLIEKKIETIIAEKKAKTQKKASSGVKKKIKLKRKVSADAESHVISEIKKHSDEIAPEKTGADKTSQPKSAVKKSSERPADKPSASRPVQGRTAASSSPRSNTARPQGFDSRRPASGSRPTQGTRPAQGARPGQTARPTQGARPAQGARPGQSSTGQRRPTGAGATPFTKSTQEVPVASEVGDKSGKSKRRNRERDKERENLKNKRSEKLDREQRVYNSHITKKRKPVVKQVREAVTPDNIEITENISVGDLAKKLNVKANEVIGKLMKLGVLATINQILDSETAEILAEEYGTSVKVVSLYDETVIKEDEIQKDIDVIQRPPIVTVMGHVDHGKTKLLDTIRKSNVTAGEHGGITQHIGAYKVKVHDQWVTFLDTPGHAAFTTMRARGARVTDIVILIVAANDGVMPQTVEAINHAKEANVPIIVAINKIDLPEANPAKVRQELAGYDLVPEEWGGTTLYCEISAKNDINVNALLEQVLMQAEILELKANPRLRAKGSVIEAKLDPGRGAVATLLVETGTLHVGDSFVVGIYAGKIRAMFDDQGNSVTEAGPAMPVEILGLDGIPSAGDPFQVVASEKYAKQIAGKRQELRRVESAKQVKKVSLEDLNDMIKEGEVQDVRLIIKADVDGSVQALKDALEKLSTDEVRVKVIHAAAGGINESDVMLASASNAIVIGYHVRPTPKVSDLADQEKVSIKTYNIIFEVTQDIKSAMEGMLKPDIEEESTGMAEVMQVFKISKLGTIAGCTVIKGKVHRTNKVRLLRDGVVLFDGDLKSLKRFKDDANEVEMGQECGIGLNKFNDIKVGDIFESYRLVEIAKKLGD